MNCVDPMEGPWIHRASGADAQKCVVGADSVVGRGRLAGKAVLSPIEEDETRFSEQMKSRVST